MSRPYKPVPAAVARLGRRITTFREEHPKRSRLPAELWAEALRLSHEHDVATVARGAGLGYASLKQRREAATSVVAEGAEPAPFVELRATEVFGGSPARPEDTEVELTDAQGARLRVRLGAAAPSRRELGVLLTALWRERR
jgi:hypothetical protein